MRFPACTVVLCLVFPGAVSAGDTRVAAALGVGLFDSGGLGGGGARLGLPKDFAGGLSGSREWSFLALDTEGLFAGGSETIVTTSGTTGERAFRSHGTFADLRAFVPFAVGGGELKLYGGIGGGLVTTTASETGDAGLVEIGQRLYGAYAVLGVELRPFPWLRVRGDYSRSFLTDAVDEVGDGTVKESVALGGASFERWRGKTTFAVGGGFDLGAVVAYRKSEVVPEGAAPSTFGLLQFAFEVGYRFR